MSVNEDSRSDRVPLHYPHTSIFDLDHTLCKVNTSFRFGIHLLQERVLSFYQIPFLLSCYFFHKCGAVSMADLHYHVCRHFFQGKQVELMAEHVEGFLNAQLRQMLNLQIFSLFEQARAQGHYTILLSSSPDFIVGEIARRTGFHEWGGTQYSIGSDNVIEQIGQLMEGENKAHFVQKYREQMNVGRADITAYSDSYLDLPFLEAVGNPVAVNPDKKLRMISMERGWKII